MTHFICNQFQILYILVLTYDAPSSNAGYECTHRECAWANYLVDQEYGFFYTSDGKNISGNNCDECMNRCNSESWCSHIECGNDQPFLDGSIRKSHCSYWRTGSCEEPVEFTLNPQNYIYTCKKLSKFRNIHCLFWGMVWKFFLQYFY